MLANATVQSVTGQVTAAGAAVTQGQRITPGSAVTTGAGARVLMRFDDGQSVLLNENTEFRIAEFNYNEASPQQDRSIFDILKGAARFVTGAIGRRSQTAFQLRAPQATIGIRGTDFMVAIVNPLYLGVTQGAIAAANTAGTVPFAAGAYGSVASFTTLATAIPFSALPAAAAGAFTSMSSVTISAVGVGGQAAGAGTATGTAAGGAGIGTAAAIGAAAAAAAAVTSGGETTTTTHH